MAEQLHVYKSDLGDDFKTFHNWCLDTLSAAELAIYETGVQTPEYLAIYERWWQDQKILSHEVWENGVKLAP